jgi:hypothetical protein
VLFGGRARLRVSNAKLAVLVLVAASSARATPDEDRAQQLFVDGQAQLRAGDVASACALLAESLRLDSALGTLLNLAVCHEQQGKLATALRQYALVVEWARARGESADDRLQFAEEHARALSPRVPRLWISVAGQLTDVQVLLDGRLLSAAEVGGWLEIDPGRHRLEAMRNGQRVWEHRELELLPGARLVEYIQLPELPSDAPRKTPSTWVYVIGGLGAASVITGGAFLIRANTYDDRVEQKTRQYFAHQPRDPELAKAALEDYDTAVQAQRIGLALGALGIVSLGTATVLWLRERHDDAPSRGAALLLRPHAGGATVSVEGAF